MATEIETLREEMRNSIDSLRAKIEGLKVAMSPTKLRETRKPMRCYTDGIDGVMFENTGRKLHSTEVIELLLAKVDINGESFALTTGKPWEPIRASNDATKWDPGAVGQYLHKNCIIPSQVSAAGSTLEKVTSKRFIKMSRATYTANTHFKDPKAGQGSLKLKLTK